MAKRNCKTEYEILPKIVFNSLLVEKHIPVNLEEKRLDIIYKIAVRKFGKSVDDKMPPAKPAWS